MGKGLLVSPPESVVQRTEQIRFARRIRPVLRK